MIATVHTAVPLGTDAHAVLVEVHTARALPGFSILGVPDGNGRETRDRVRAAIMSAGLDWPDNQRITVNFTPNLVHRPGSGVDLAIAAGVLAATGQLEPATLNRLGFAGELGLDGTVRHTPSIAAIVASDPQRRWIVPAADLDVARAVGVDARHLDRLAQLPDAVDANIAWRAPDRQPRQTPRPVVDADRLTPIARSCVAVAAAGGHHLLLLGLDDVGHGDIASQLVALLPDLAPEAALEATVAHSAADQRVAPISRPTLRTPHHATSTAALLGGAGSHLRPGEFTLAHHGVLYIAALEQLPASHLDALRYAVTQHHISVVRGATRAVLPADFQLVAAANRCACGAHAGACVCSPRERHSARLAGPLIDLFDLRIDLEQPAAIDIPADGLAERVAQARAMADARNGSPNARLEPDRLREVAPLDRAAEQLLRDEVAAGRITGRGHTRIHRLARTLADLDTLDLVTAHHVHAALALRANLRRSGLSRPDPTLEIAHHLTAVGPCRGCTR